MGLSLYTVDSAYCDFLRIHDRCVPYTMDKKSNRPFIGIVFSVNGFDYFAPLTSPKAKHLKMKNTIDFMKINSGVWGAINFNNMIPICRNVLTTVYLNILPTDGLETVAYKNLLKNQLSWCNKTENKKIIKSKANNLYKLVTEKKADGKLLSRCCNFLEDEKQCTIYCQNHNIV